MLVFPGPDVSGVAGGGERRGANMLWGASSYFCFTHLQTELLQASPVHGTFLGSQGSLGVPGSWGRVLSRKKNPGDRISAQIPRVLHWTLECSLHARMVIAHMQEGQRVLWPDVPFLAERKQRIIRRECQVPTLSLSSSLPFSPSQEEGKISGSEFWTSELSVPITMVYTQHPAHSIIKWGSPVYGPSPGSGWIEPERGEKLWALESLSSRSHSFIYSFIYLFVCSCIPHTESWAPPLWQDMCRQPRKEILTRLGLDMKTEDYRTVWEGAGKENN